MAHRTTTLVFAALTLAAISGQASAQMTIHCDDENQLDQLAIAQYYGGLALLTSGGYLADLRDGGDSARFDYWFGKHDPSLIDRVENTLAKVYYAIDDLTFDCDCPPDEVDIEVTWAFRRSSDPDDHLRLCPLFFNTHDTGELAGTFVHEISHLFGTQDCMNPIPLCPKDAPVPWNAELAHDFAQRDPVTSTNNAYNLERFVTDIGRPR